MYLEFLGLERKAAYYEKDLESAIITRLQHFLLELGQGFTFVARQKRILLEDDEFFADLVFYNRLLKCFVVIELKTGKLTHQDLGQLQMYVNYYDRVEKTAEENPTIGILLWASCFVPVKMIPPCAWRYQKTIKPYWPANTNSICPRKHN